MRKGFLGAKEECLHGISLGEQRGGLNQPHQSVLLHSRALYSKPAKTLLNSLYFLLIRHPQLLDLASAVPFLPTDLSFVPHRREAPGARGISAFQRYSSCREGQGRGTGASDFCMVSCRCSALVKHPQLGCRGKAGFCHILANKILRADEVLEGKRRGGEPMGQRWDTAG